MSNSDIMYIFASVIYMRECRARLPNLDFESVFYALEHFSQIKTFRTVVVLDRCEYFTEWRILVCEYNHCQLGGIQFPITFDKTKAH